MEITSVEAAVLCSSLPTTVRDILAKRPGRNQGSGKKQLQLMSQTQKVKEWMGGKATAINGRRAHVQEMDPELPLTGQRLRAEAIDAIKEAYDKLSKSGVVSAFLYTDPKTGQQFVRILQVRTVDIPLGKMDQDLLHQLSFLPNIMNPLPVNPEGQPSC
jgi:hypothetical protein